MTDYIEETEQTKENSYKKWAKGKKPSMERRWENHNYTAPAFYMFTIQTHERRRILGVLRIPDDFNKQDKNISSISDDFNKQTSSVGRTYCSASSHLPFVQLSTIGQAVVEQWKAISLSYPQIENRMIMVMPDHIHGILIVKETIPIHIGKIIATFKHKSQKRAYLALQNTGKLDNARNFVKITDTNSVKIWAPKFNDRIIKDEKQLSNTLAYLKDNPLRLAIKLSNSDLFVQRKIQIGDITYNSIGNRRLLSHKLIQVKCSRSLTKAQIDETIDYFLKQGMKGTVIISPFYSPGEKAVEKAFQENNLPIIKILENGFSMRYKPSGKNFTSCANGSLLLLAPWEHHNENITTSREQCLMLNSMAKDICNTINKLIK